MRYAILDHEEQVSPENWRERLVVRNDGEDGLTKEGPDLEDAVGPDRDDDLQSVFDDRSHELNRPASLHRPSLFDVQFGAVALAAGVVWEQLREVTGTVVVRSIQMERIEVSNYASDDPSEIAEGTVHFRAEMEAVWPNYRRAQVTIPVEIRDGRPRHFLVFVDPSGRRYALTKDAVNRYMAIKEWYNDRRQPDVGLALIDRVQQTDFPYTRTRHRMVWDIGMV